MVAMILALSLSRAHLWGCYAWAYNLSLPSKPKILESDIGQDMEAYCAGKY